MRQGHFSCKCISLSFLTKARKPIASRPPDVRPRRRTGGDRAAIGDRPHTRLGKAAKIAMRRWRRRRALWRDPRHRTTRWHLRDRRARLGGGRPLLSSGRDIRSRTMRASASRRRSRAMRPHQGSLASPLRPCRRPVCPAPGGAADAGPPRGNPPRFAGCGSPTRRESAFVVRPA
jgi:hypothetical protein